MAERACARPLLDNPEVGVPDRFRLDGKTALAAPFALTHLAASAMTFVTGQAIVADGGWTAR